MDLADLKVRVAAATADDFGPEFDLINVLDQMVFTAERRCLRDLDPLAMRASATLTLSPGVRVLSALPAGWWLPRRLRLTAPFRRLERRDLSYLEAYWPDITLRGTPRYWAMQDETSIVLAPVPMAALTALAEYTRLPTVMSQANPGATWVSTNYPDLLFDACMIFMQGYQKNYGSGDDPQGGGFWEAQYKVHLAGAAAEEARKKGTAPFEVTPTPAPLVGMAS
jgi:hypothetical protein